MRRIIDDLNSTQALVNSINLREQFRINNPFIDSQLLETQRLCASLRCDVLKNNPIIEVYKNSFDHNSLTQVAQLSANTTNLYANVHKALSSLTKVSEQIYQAQLLAKYATEHLNANNVLYENIRQQFSNNYFDTLPFESNRLKKYFETIFPQTTLYPNLHYLSDSVQVYEQNTPKGKHFDVYCTETIQVTEQEPLVCQLRESIKNLDEKLPALYLSNFTREEIITIIGIIVTIIFGTISHLDANRAHDDALQAHLDAERAHQDAIISQQNDQIQIEQGNRIIELLEKNQTIDIKLLEEMRALREAQKVNIKNSNVNNEKRHE